MSTVQEKLRKFTGELDPSCVVTKVVHSDEEAHLSSKTVQIPTSFSFAVDRNYQELVKKINRDLTGNINTDDAVFLTGVNGTDYDEDDNNNDNLGDEHNNDAYRETVLSSRYSDVERDYMSEDVTVASSAGFGTVQDSDEGRPSNDHNNSNNNKGKTNQGRKKSVNRYVPAIISKIQASRSEKSVPAAHVLRAQSNYPKIYTYK